MEAGVGFGGHEGAGENFIELHVGGDASSLSPQNQISQGVKTRKSCDMG